MTQSQAFSPIMLDDRPLPSSATMFHALEQRDSSYEGVFFAAIRTTGIFCRPTCPARKPRPDNVEFFASSRAAVAAGYRPCKRCNPLEPTGKPPEWLAALIQQVESEPVRRWTDSDLRKQSLDPVRVRRWFLRNHGLTFHAYQRARRLGLALDHLRNGAKWEGVGYTHGYESASGFSDAFSRAFERTPQRARELAPVTVERLLTPLGPVIAGAVGEGLCLLTFEERDIQSQISRLGRIFGTRMVPGASPHIALLEKELALYFAGGLRSFSVPLVFRGTPFQQLAWKELLSIPYAETISYDQQARRIGRPGAQRAVGRANGDNRIAIVIPCHRVVRSDGQLCGYGGGLWRKKFLLDLEREHRGS